MTRRPKRRCRCPEADGRIVATPRAASRSLDTPLRPASRAHEQRAVVTVLCPRDVRRRLLFASLSVGPARVVVAAVSCESARPAVGRVSAYLVGKLAADKANTWRSYNHPARVHGGALYAEVRTSTSQCFKTRSGGAGPAWVEAPAARSSCPSSNAAGQNCDRSRSQQLRPIPVTAPRHPSPATRGGAAAAATVLERGPT
eukprot:365117-Chlamydomonas_euryale.AAC.9